MANIFQLFGTIFIDNSEANKNIDTTTQKAEKSGSKIGAAFAAIGKGAVALGTAVVGTASAVGAGAYAMANSTAAEADVIDKLSERTSINREELQRWMHAADQSGVSSDVLETAIKKMSSTLDDAAMGSAKSQEALDRLGISLEELDGLSTEEKFNVITNALADMEDGTERNALGADLLGKAYTEMLPLLNAGSEGINALKQEADDLGIVMSEDSVKAGVVLGDTIANVKAGFNGLKNQLGNAMIPIIQKGADMVIQALPKIQKLIDKLSPTVEKSVEMIMPPLMSLVATLLPLLLELGESLLPMITQIVADVLPEIVNLLLLLSPFMVQLIQQILPFLVSTISVLLPLLINLVGQILPPLITLITTLLPYALQLVQMILPQIVQLFELLMPIILQIVDGVLPVLIELINTILPIIIQVVSTLLPTIISLIEQLLPSVLQIIELILPTLLTLIQTIMPLLVSIIESVLPLLVTAMRMLSPILLPLLDILISILEPLTQLLNWILPPLISLIENQAVKQLGRLKEVLSLVAETIGERLIDAFEATKRIFENYKNIFQNIINFIKNVFTGNWKGAWQNVVNIFKCVWDNMKTIVKAPINFIIDGINTLIKGINKIKFDVPSWVPGIGGKTLGFNVPTIPKLRRGLDYVPRDDYPALLHRGERVLTASEAQAQDRVAETAKKTANKKSGGGVTVTVHIEHFYNSAKEDLDELVEYVIEKIDEKINREEEVFA